MNLVFATRPGGCAVESESRGKRRRPALLPVLAYAVGGAVGGAGAAAVIAVVGRAVTSHSAGWLGVLVKSVLYGVGIIAVYLECRHQVSPLPENRRQVPRHWTAWKRRWKTGFAFGMIIGAGVFTYLHHASVYVLGVVVALAGMSGHVRFAILTGLVYGLTRGFAVLLAWIRQSHCGFDEWDRRVVSTAARVVPVLASVSLVAALVWIRF